MEASALPAPAAIGRISVSARLLRLRSDEQLVALFRDGCDEAFQVIHDRYRQRLFAYVRQMLAGSRPDAEDAMQDVFIRAYGALRANDRPVTLRAWLYRVAHNRCIDQLRRPVPAPAEVFELSRQPLRDPLAETERREDLRRLVADVRQLPEQQRSALLMREMQGMSYSELADALDVSLPAVKSLLVRARMGLVEAAEARDADCVEIREGLLASYDRGVRMSGRVRRHMRECSGCCEFRLEMRGVRRGLRALTPAGAGMFGVLARLGLGGSGAAAGGGAASGAITVGGGGLAAAGATKLALVCCAAVLATGGAPVAHQGSSRAAHAHRSGVEEGLPAEPAVLDLGVADAANPPSFAPASPAVGIASVTGPGTSGRRHHPGSFPLIDPDSGMFSPYVDTSGATPPTSPITSADAGIPGSSPPASRPLAGVLDPTGSRGDPLSSPARGSSSGTSSSTPASGGQHSTSSGSGSTGAGSTSPTGSDSSGASRDGHASAGTSASAGSTASSSSAPSGSGSSGAQTPRAQAASSGP